MQYSELALRKTLAALHFTRFKEKALPWDLFQTASQIMKPKASENADPRAASAP
jgi:hypothetical protein